MFMSSTATTRRAKPSHEVWAPHPYQKRAVEFLCANHAAALFLDPGLGKTSITLAAFTELLASGTAKKMLVIAPLRVVQTVWSQESKKWTQFRHLRFSVLYGPKKGERLKDDADVWLINPEGCQWLSDQFFGRSLPFDTVVIDELTKFKNHRAVRAKALRPKLKTVRRRWGLTGTPIPNGYLDLFGQFLILGAALGKYVTHYRDQYFQPDHMGFEYTLQPGAAARIEQRIAPYVLRMAAEDYLDLPPLVDDLRYVDLEPTARATYTEMKKNMLAELPEGTVTGANAAAVYSKLKQMANGAVYVSVAQSNEKRSVAHVHDTKLDAMEELVEELQGAPLLVAYEFNSDLDRLKARLGKDTPHLGSGVNGKETAAIVEAWNAGEIPVLLAHPASAGHGLNLQGSGASHIAWFGPTWDLELYEQFIQRVHRQGTTSQRIVNHIFVARDTIDELVVEALRDKSVTQEKLLASLSAEILRDETAAKPKETEMPEVQKLSRQNNGAPAAEPRRIVPKGWGNAASQQAAPNLVINHARAEEVRQQAIQSDDAPRTPKGWPTRQAAPVTDAVEQHREITRKITQSPEDRGEADVNEEQPPAQVLARSMFSKAVQEKLDATPFEVVQQEPAATAVDTLENTKGEPEVKAPEKRSRARAQAAAFSADDVELRKLALQLAARPDIQPSEVIGYAMKYADFLRGAT